MLIRSIRLQNIKSFGSGPEGTGVRVAFERGLNRLAGPNGAGKSTVIEALGYVLFDHAPETHARLDLETLLLRNGAKEGEVEAEIETDGERHLVRRGVGKQSRTRWTVRDGNGYVTHETEDEVRRFLATAVGLNDPAALPDLFRKLVGVRQGRLLDPFELTPVEAKKHFAPILEIDIYQQCFTELLEPVRRLERDLQEAIRKRDVARAQAELLAAAPQEAERLAVQLAGAEAELQRAQQALAAARDELAVHEKREHAIPAARAGLETARKEVESADKALLARRELLQRAEQASKVLEATAAGHAAFAAAQKTLDALSAQRRPLEGARERASHLRQQLAAAQAQAQEADRQARELMDELEKRAAELERRRSAAEKQRKAAEENAAAAAPPEDSEILQQARGLLAEAERWAATLEGTRATVKQAGADAAEANRKLANYDPAVIQRAEAARDAARKSFEAKKQEYTELDARRRSRREMARVLEDQRLCPLLAEKCRQFDAGKLVLSEVKLDEIIEALKQEAAEAEATFNRTEEAVQAAQKLLADTETTRVVADRALRDLNRCIENARDVQALEHWDASARAFALGSRPPIPLPDLLDLPHPGLDPWKALATASLAAESYAAYAQAAGESVAAWRKQLEQRQQACFERERRLELERHAGAAEAQRLAEYAEESQRLRAEHERRTDRVRTALAAIEQQSKALEDVAARQKSLETLEAQASEAEQARAAHAETQRRYVAAEADAARLDQARADVAVAVGELERARAAAAGAMAARDAAIAAYEAPAHARARKALEEAAGRVMALERDLAHGREQLEEARRRITQLQTAQAAWQAGEAQRALLDARRELLEHARRTLREAGPKVAERLVQAVNARAQRLYNALAPQDPGQLEWQADFELRVATSNGVRRFAMLSGGQKVKAALALQIALVQQFSRAGICVFDEPTYALDADSRALLAEAIADAQAASKFEQLFVVSHDDAFDGRAEHTVALQYAPATGTSVE